MDLIIVAGIGTDVGKTVVSAILCEMLGADYWKPIDCGSEDGEAIEKLTSSTCIFPPAYSLSAPISPHQAAHLEGITIDPSRIELPKTRRPLVIEMAGGLLVPLSQTLLNIDLFKQWSAEWVLVSRQYVGSINHTLLSARALQPLIPHLVFNGERMPYAEDFILSNTGLPHLGTVHQEPNLTQSTIQEYACLWHSGSAFGTLTPK